MQNNIVNTLRTVLAKVDKILEENEAARDSDKVLYIEYLRRFTTLGINMFYTLDEIGECIMDIPTPETISRARRKIQQGGRWVGTRRAERAEEAEGVKEWAVKG